MEEHAGLAPTSHGCGGDCIRHPGSNECNNVRESGTPAEWKSVRLFGVKLTDYQNFNSIRQEHRMQGMMRKCVSMDNLGLMGLKQPLQRHSNSAALHRAHMETAAALQPMWLESAGLGNGAVYAGETTQSGYASDGLMQSSSMSSRERRKGVPWTEEEHRLFLAGLQKLGKGDWRGISRNFVTSRTPTQVASHAQKYFLRQCNLNKRKRRSSLFDMNAVPATNTTEEHPQSIAAAELNQPIWELGVRQLMAPSSSGVIHPLSKLQMPSAIPTSVSADLCLGRSSCLQGQEPRVFADRLSSRHQGKHANTILFSNKAVTLEDVSARTGVDKPVISISSSSSSRSLSSSPSSSSLCRIDEASELSSLSLSIAPPMPTDVASELALKLEPPMASRQSGIFSPASKVCERKDVLLVAGA
ncbi:hypothetical protein GOP47_0000956 [Adiantum capillus-veneris]|uniref:Uncharacterized protein n=1 Tax=Adiantum capillus-veneris TaxID=13818 RepID=A0A9D4ZTE9_ADICA|nr:hypothetical protein GOP47_0000956 [Adiantum capillus-veneris]